MQLDHSICQCTLHSGNYKCRSVKRGKHQNVCRGWPAGYRKGRKVGGSAVIARESHSRVSEQISERRRRRRHQRRRR